MQPSLQFSFRTFSLLPTVLLYSFAINCTFTSASDKHWSWASLITQLVKNPPAMRETPVQFLWRSAGEGIGYPLQYSWAFLVAQLARNLPAMREMWVWSLVGRSPGEGKGFPLQYFGLENSMDCIVHRVPKSQTQLSDFHFRGFPFLTVLLNWN